MLIEIICLAFGIVFISGMLEDSGVLAYLLDLTTILILLVLTLPALFVNGLAGDFARLFYKKKDKKERLGDLKRSLLAVELLQKQFIYSGLIIAAMETLFILHRLTALEELGPKLSILVIALFYVGVVELLLMPIKVAVEKRITEYMEEDD